MKYQISKLVRQGWRYYLTRQLPRVR